MILLVVLGTACNLAGGANAPYPAGLSDQMIDVGGVGRQFRVHVPAGLSTPRAVVFVLHGGGGEGLDVANLGSHPLSVFRTVADREGFAVVYPGGLPANDATARAGWVDCRADNTVSSGADDVGFLAALVTRVRGEYGLSSADMFMAGGSNGAQMTHAFGFHHADLVGAVATASGSLPETPLPGPCTTGPGRPLPILVLHGTADTQMPWGGGCVANLGGACNRGRVISAEATRDRWLEINGLTEVTPVKSVIEVSSTDAGPAFRWDYAGASPLQWWRLEGAGHTTPSQTVLTTPNSVTGTQNRDIEFAEVAWSFFAARLAAGGRTISVPDGQTLTQSQAGHPLISGASDVRKVGGGTLLLNAANSYTGPTSISAGGLTLTNPSALGSSPAIEVAAAALLDVRPLVGGLSIGSGQILGGDGTVAGSIAFGRGSTLSPGMSSGESSAAVAASDGARNVRDLIGVTTAAGFDQRADLPVNPTAVPVPEPSTYAMVLASLACGGMSSLWPRRNRPGARHAAACRGMRRSDTEEDYS